MTVGVHITHEAIKKIGGIGTVLHGLVVTKNYKKLFPKTLLYSPLFHYENKLESRLGENALVYYSGLDKYDNDNWRSIFARIEDKYNVHIVYGKKKFKDKHLSKSITTVDIVAVDIWKMKKEHIDDFKFKLWKYFGMQSERYQHDSDYEQYLRIGIVLKEIYEALYGDTHAVIFSHEYMGMPSALAWEIEKKEGHKINDKTVFYAHEVSTARVVTENSHGHDLSFYNVLKEDSDEGISLEQEYGSFSHYSRNELVKIASKLDYVFAVSDITKEEYLYLCPAADQNRVKVVYNGIPIEKVTWAQKEKSIALMKNYCENLYNFEPDYIFTHVTRLVTSKAIWRDIRFLYYLDESLAKQNKKGFYILLSTLIGSGRSHEDIAKMEIEYGWPVKHREAWPDLVGPEIDIYNQLELFNARSKVIKGVFVNQFGFDNISAGSRVPKGTSPLTIRIASDVEFGLSIYEPFGIAQLETIPYGGTAVLSTSCGCASLLQKTMDDNGYAAIDFTKVPDGLADQFKTKKDYKNVSLQLRDLVETEICIKSAPSVIGVLPKSNIERKSRLVKMQRKSTLLDWEHVAERIIEYLTK